MKKGQQRYVIFGILKCNTHIKESIHEIRQAKKNFEKGGGVVSSNRTDEASPLIQLTSPPPLFQNFRTLRRGEG